MELTVGEIVAMEHTIDEIYREWVRYGIIGSKENFQARNYYISVVRINFLGQCKDFVLVEGKAVEMYDIESEV